ncbi:MAG TPA: SIMPL domain-containing protein [Candidatus Limnocylindria bacterium]|nr:SIMPL domain-containing protein [Candidatus Limnocylindria bacterium]
MSKSKDSGSWPARTISVSGTGRVLVSPDLVDLRFGVTVTAAKIAKARSEAATAMTAVIAGLKATEMADRDLQTSVVSVNPAYDYSGGTPKLVGYTITNLVAATLRDVAKLGDAIDAALEAGATSIDRLAFGVSKQAEVEQEARAAAVADARAKAETLATAAGVAISGVAAIAEFGAVPYPARLAEMKTLAPRDASTPVESGANEISVGVSVTFLIDAS